MPNYYENPHIICKLLAVTRPSSRYSSYKLGLKKCSRCNEYFNTPDLKCSCCGVFLKSTPRSTNAKRAFERTPDIQYIFKPKYKLTEFDFNKARQILREIEIKKTLRKLEKNKNDMEKYHSDPEYRKKIARLNIIYHKKSIAFSSFWNRINGIHSPNLKKNQTQRRYMRSIDFNGYRAFMRMIERSLS